MVVWIADSSKRSIKLMKILNKFKNISKIEIYKSDADVLNNQIDKCNVLFVSADSPEFDWVKVVKHAKENGNNCNIIFFSNIILSQKDYLSYRISGYITYPFDEREVEHELDNLRFTIKNNVDFY